LHRKNGGFFCGIGFIGVVLLAGRQKAKAGTVKEEFV
jgi:hypothetical protein